ncbi:MAG: hypothetical protein QOE92_1928 [Chloroflexota bacterium]|jgi:hypothetical protein|nr:hypothetical protein [Chloroflexota bacterium]
MNTEEHDHEGHDHEGHTHDDHNHGEQSKVLDARDEAQEEQIEAQAEGDTGAEVKAFLKETIIDHVQFPKDIVEDSKDPSRREDEEQGTPEHPEVEPGAH